MKSSLMESNNNTATVKLDDVNDFVAPSQACVNPAFAPTTTASSEKAAKPAATVRRRRRRRVIPKQPSTAEETNEETTIEHSLVPPPSSDVAPKEDQKSLIQASLADCLACSGCVTTAETVLLEQTHSLDKLQTMDATTTIIITISPLSLADFCRHIQVDNTLETQRQFTTLLSQRFSKNNNNNPVWVVNAALPLQWSWQAQAQEFVTKYNRQKQSKQSLISGSCPAIVCWMETSSHEHVDQLSTTVSAMRAMDQVLQSTTTTSSEKNIQHVAIMPCHDKKLEASRAESLSSSSSESGVLLPLLCITTSELVQLLSQPQQNLKEQPPLKEQLLQCQPAQVLYDSLPEDWTTTATGEEQEAGSSRATWITSPSSSSSSQSKRMIQVSGGHADYIFRYAAQALFGYAIPHHVNPWTPLSAGSTTSTSVTVKSARLAKASQRRHAQQAILYEIIITSDDNGTRKVYATSRPETHDTTTSTCTPVLRFCMAHGLPTVQRMLQSQPSQSSQQSSQNHWDYIEAMGCASGCLNGGGQLKVHSQGANGDARETPTESRQRIQDGLAQLEYMTPSDSTSSSPTKVSLTATSYQKIPPLQHVLGATAGVQVQALEW